MTTIFLTLAAAPVLLVVAIKAMAYFDKPTTPSSRYLSVIDLTAPHDGPSPYGDFHPEPVSDE